MKQPRGVGLGCPGWSRLSCVGLSGQFVDDLEVHCCVYYDAHMVPVVSRLLVGVVDGVHDDLQHV